MNAAVSALIYDGQSGGWVRRLELQRPMRPVPVVVLDVDSENLLQVPATHDEQPVQALGPHGPDPALGVGIGVRRLQRRDQHLGVLRIEHVVEPAAELRVTITNKDADPASSFLEDKQRSPAPHCGQNVPPQSTSDSAPLCVTSSHAGELHTPVVKLDEEQHVQPLQPDRVDGEEVARNDPGALLA